MPSPNCLSFSVMRVNYLVSLIGAAFFSPMGDFGACMHVMKVPKEK